MKTRYCAKHYNYNDSGHGNSNIEKYLKREIDFLLAPSANQLNKVDFDEIYLPIPDAEKFLSSVLVKSPVDKVLYLTGLTGSGKSMILKSVFRCGGMTPRFCDNTLIIPFSFDNFSSGDLQLNSNKGIETVFSNMLSCACEKIEANCPNLKRVEGNEEDFFEMVKNSRGDYTQVADTWPRPPINERMKRFISENPIPFHSAVLKYYLNQDACDIDNLIILVDDVEGAGEKNELLPVKVAYRVITCLENIPASKEWSAHLVISCRNYVYRLLIDNNYTPEHQYIETYTESDVFHIESAPAVIEIAKKRYDAISKKESSEKWKTALDVVLLLIGSIDSSIGEFILNIKIRNIRKALSLTKQIVYNKQWIQRDYIEDVPGAFSIDSVKDYNVTPAALIRAIGMRESLIYCSNESDIPNIMYNAEDLDLYPLLVLKYCIIRRNSKYSNWNDTINLKYFYERIAYTFQENSNYVNKFKKACEYLILNRLLLRSIDQLQDNALPVSEQNVSKIDQVYLSNSAVDLWDMLGKNSVILEMYIDDIWIDNSERTNSKHQFRGFDFENFQSALRYLDALIEIESVMKSHTDNIGRRAEYIDLFGDDSICMHLLKGLKNSVIAFFKEDANAQPEMKIIESLMNKI
ncbi:MAG: hypothetical protein J1E85_09090 [Ruminococcus sp.]|nr:hypothetical protein [Ruminococcus sp.]